MSLEITRKRTIPVRALRFPLDASVPRAWLATLPAASCAVDALSLLFPDGERFFIRAVKDHLDHVEDDPELVAQVRGFIGQEGRHGHEHDRMNRMLEAQGFDVEPFLRWYRRVAYGAIEPSVPPVLRLSTTVALEHLTATFAEVALRSGILDDAPPALRDLLRWHAAEEIEHKAVAFDVLQRVDPRYATRMAGLAVGIGVLSLFWSVGFASLMAQAPERFSPPADPEVARRFAHEHGRLWRSVVASVRDYLRADFHPDDRDNLELAREQIASMPAYP